MREGLKGTECSGSVVWWKVVDVIFCHWSV